MAQRIQTLPPGPWWESGEIQSLIGGKREGGKSDQRLGVNERGGHVPLVSYR